MDVEQLYQEPPTDVSNDVCGIVNSFLQDRIGPGTSIKWAPPLWPGDRFRWVDFFLLPTKRKIAEQGMVMSSQAIRFIRLLELHPKTIYKGG